MTQTELNNQIDVEITTQTDPNSITPTIIGENMKDVVEFAEKKNKTAGLVEGDSTTPYQVLTFDLNTVSVSASGASVVLPTTTIVGKEVYVLAASNGSAFLLKGNQAGSSVISTGGISSQTGSLSVATNTSYRCIHLGGGFWKTEAM